MKSQRSKFLVSFFATMMVGCVVVTISNFVAPLPGTTTKPSLPVLGKTYVSAANGGQTDHFLFYSGLFGIAERLQKADFLMLGSSHIEFGLSAQQLAAELSSRGQHLAGFNLGLGSAEGLPFARLIIEKHNLNNKLSLLDVFMGHNGGLSPQAQIALEIDRVGAYVAVSRIWINYFRDWLFDGYLPQVAFDHAKGFQRRRFLHNLIILRDWRTGDVVETWSPMLGDLFNEPPLGIARTVQPGPPLPAGLWLNTDVQHTLIAQGHDAVVVGIPYQAQQFSAERALAVNSGFTAIEIDSKDILLWDNAHLTAAGRTLATSLLASALQTRGLRFRR